MKFPKHYQHMYSSAILNDTLDSRKLIYKKQSPHQLIELYKTKNGEYWLALNGVMQFHSLECHKSHVPMVGFPAIFAENLGSILIIGGGDGFAAQEALKYPFKKIVNVELDADLLNLTTNHPVMRKLTDDTFRNPRVKVIAGDGIRYLISSKEKFDVIIDDCEFDITGQSSLSKALYKQYENCLVTKLTDGGVGSLMEPYEVLGDFDETPYLQAFKWHQDSIKGKRLNSKQERSVKQAMMAVQDSCDEDFKLCMYNWKNRAPHIKSYREGFPKIGYESFIFFSKRPITAKRPLRS